MQELVGSVSTDFTIRMLSTDVVSLCEHGTVKIMGHRIDLLAKEMNCIKILPIYCYNDDDNDLLTAIKQRTQFIFNEISVT